MRDEYGTYWYADEGGTVWEWRDENNKWTLITSASDAIKIEERTSTSMWPKFTKPGFWTRVNIFAKIDRHMREADALDRGDYDNPLIKGKYTQEELDQIEGVRKWQRRLDTWAVVMYQPELGAAEWAGVMRVSEDVRAAALAAKTESAAAKAALLRAETTLRNARNVSNITRTTTTATGKETFHHTTMNIGKGAQTPQSAAVNIAESKSLNVSPGGQVGQFGEGAYAYEGAIPAGSKAPMVQFNVAPGTAIERIAIPGEQTIIRLVPAEGKAVTIANPVTNLSAAEMKEAVEWLAKIKDLIK